MTVANPIGLEQIASAFRRSAYNAYCNTLIGSAPRCITEAFQRMTNPVIGDWVIETTTIGRFRHSGGTDLDAIGVLENVAAEPVKYSDPDFVWDEKEEGRPHPTERVYYIRTLDGRSFRWINANIVAILTAPLDLTRSTPL